MTGNKAFVNKIDLNHCVSVNQSQVFGIFLIKYGGNVKNPFVFRGFFVLGFCMGMSGRKYGAIMGCFSGSSSLW